MKSAIRRIVQNMIKEPSIKVLIEEELNKYNDDQSIVNILVNNADISRIKIDKECRVFLIDYNNTEIFIQGYQAKTLYILYLLSPYGIANVDLHKYKNIMIKIYMEICKHKICDEYRSAIVVDGLLTREGGITDATNKIRKAFKNIIINSSIFKNYIITGNRRGKRSIAIPKQMITIENQKLNEIAALVRNLNKESV